MGQDTWLSVKGLPFDRLDPDNSVFPASANHSKLGKKSRSIPGGTSEQGLSPQLPRLKGAAHVFIQISSHPHPSVKKEGHLASSVLVSSRETAHRPWPLSFPAYPSFFCHVQSGWEAGANRQVQYCFVVCSHLSSHSFKAQYRC